MREEYLARAKIAEAELLKSQVFYHGFPNCSVTLTDLYHLSIPISLH